MGNLSGETCSLLESGLNVGFLCFCKCNSRGVQVWRPLASLQMLLVLLGEVNKQTPGTHPNTHLTATAFNNLLGTTNTSLLYFHANKGNFPMEKAGRKLHNASKGNVSQCLSICAITQNAYSQPALFLFGPKKPSH